MPRFLGGVMNTTGVVPANFAYDTSLNGLFDMKNQVQSNGSGVWPTAGKAGRGYNLYYSSVPGAGSDTASTWTVPTGVTSVSILCVGAGGSGGIYRVGSGYTQCGGGGGGGGVRWLNDYAVTPGEQHAVQGGGGGGIQSDPSYYGTQAGQNGGNSFFKNTGGSVVLQANGGTGGLVGGGTAAGGGGSGGTGYAGGTGGKGSSGTSLSHARGGQGGGAGRSNGTGVAGTPWNTSQPARTNMQGSGYDIFTGASVPAGTYQRINTNGNAADPTTGPKYTFRNTYVLGWGGGGNENGGTGAGLGGGGCCLIMWPGDIYKWPYPGIST